MITTSLEFGLTVLCVELVIISTAMIVLSNRRLKNVHEQDVAAATELVEKVENNEDTRKQALATVFREKYRFQEDDIPAAVDEFLSRERAFYNAVLGAYLNRGEAQLADLNDELTKVVAPWISLTPNDMVEGETLAAAERAKGAVETELAETKEILETMMREYDKAFNKEAIFATDDLADTESDPEPAREQSAAGVGPQEPRDDTLSQPAAADSAVAEQDAAVMPANDLDPEFDLGDDTSSGQAPADTPPAGAAPAEVIDEAIGEAVQSVKSPTDEPMTPDDLDALMEGLEADPEEEYGPA